MSLLMRRRMMMQMQENENIVYIDNGFIPMSGHVNDVPAYNEDYPTAYTTSAIPIAPGDTLHVACKKFQNKDKRVRVYDENGDYVTLYTSWDVEITEGAYIRILSLADTSVIEKITIQKTGGPAIDYKIIDRRG